MTRPTRDDVYLQIAKIIATRSTCIRRSVGCVLVDARGRILSTGYNGVAAGRPHCNEPKQYPLGIEYPNACNGAYLPSGTGLEACGAIHAEQNAILLLQDPWAVDTAYVTVSPCESCIKLLLGTSCRRIVSLEVYNHSNALAWWKEAGRELEVR